MAQSGMTKDYLTQAFRQVDTKARRAYKFLGSASRYRRQVSIMHFNDPNDRGYLISDTISKAKFDAFLEKLHAVNGIEQLYHSRSAIMVIRKDNLADWQEIEWELFQLTQHYYGWIAKPFLYRSSFSNGPTPEPFVI